MVDITKKKGFYWDPDLFIHFHGVDPEYWARRYKLIPFTSNCTKCGASLTTSIPWAQGSLRGLRAPTCQCGNKNTPYCMVRDSSDGDLFCESQTEHHCVTFKKSKKRCHLRLVK